MKRLSQKEVNDFQKVVRDFYLGNYRSMPWREDTREYYVFVSEVMLQQTQVVRVLEKFQEFILKFPHFESLSRASNKEVLAVWSGLGYNRRAIYLRDAAKKVWEEWDGELRCDEEALISLPGIGSSTARAILTYVFNQRAPFIETNVRSVYIRHFFNSAEKVSDEEIMNLLEQTIESENPREFFWALMDYGTHLKKLYGNLSRRSKHYSKQSKFEGSLRQVRARIVKILAHLDEEVILSREDLYGLVNVHDGRFENALLSLINEGMIVERDGKVILME